MEKDVALKYTSKGKNFCLEAMQGCNLTMLNLNKRRVQAEPICPLCKDDIESVKHAIFKCDIACCVWKMWEDCPISLMDINRDVSDLAIEILHQGTQRDLEKFLGVAWRIWLNRNQVIIRKMEYQQLIFGGLQFV